MTRHPHWFSSEGASSCELMSACQGTSELLQLNKMVLLYYIISILSICYCVMASKKPSIHSWMRTGTSTNVLYCLCLVHDSWRITNSFNRTMWQYEI